MLMFSQYNICFLQYVIVMKFGSDIQSPHMNLNVFHGPPTLPLAPPSGNNLYLSVLWFVTKHLQK